MYGGHYYAYIRPSVIESREGLPSEPPTEFYETATSSGDASDGKGGKWYKFDDEHVTCVREVDAVDGCYGRGPGDGGLGSAYMLVYIRENEAPDVSRRVLITLRHDHV